MSDQTEPIAPTQATKPTNPNRGPAGGDPSRRPPNKDGKERPKKSNNNNKGAGGGSGSAKLRGRPNDSEEVRTSKTLSWILRHGAKSEGIAMRPDGYVRVVDLLANAKLRSLDLNALQEIVKADQKKRYDLISEDGNVWWIRANQGHSMKAVVELETKPILSVADIPSEQAIHGTTAKAWESISKQGLSKMTRNHIHLAQDIAMGANVVSGMRPTSTILIHINVPLALSSGLKFELSSNGVVLTEGDERGFLGKQFFAKVLRRKGKGKDVEWEELDLDTEGVPAAAALVEQLGIQEKRKTG